MRLTQEQVDRFKEIHKRSGGLEGFSDEQMAAIANGVADYYLTLFAIWQRNVREREHEDDNTKV